MMIKQIKHAILDTDFVSKANIFRKDERTLGDEVLDFPDYQFFCHAKMVQELSDHGSLEAAIWLKQKIECGKIACFSDEAIIQELQNCIAEQCYFYYLSFLKEGCDLFDSRFYHIHFSSLEEWLKQDPINRSVSFLDLLSECEKEIGHRQNYGEIKAFVLSRTIQFLRDKTVVLFCSDDFGARQGFANGAGIPCISIQSVFLKLRDIGKKKEEVEPYYQSLIRWYLGLPQPQYQVRVMKFSEGTWKRLQVPLSSVLTDIYDGRYSARKNGDLEEKQIPDKQTEGMLL